MLLSENTEAAFPSTTATTLLAKNLPTPAAVAAAISYGGSVAANIHVATPTADQKRKARPSSLQGFIKP
jgi:hypothetical protein